jgi:chemotaxis protein methyltransferase CheR
MQALNCPAVSEYRARLDRDGDARREMERRLTVSISRFFRDRQVWNVLQAEILPSLARRYPDWLAAWSAGCARGEEPYTLAAVWSRFPAPKPPLRILATDLHPGYLDQARKGVYGRGSLRDVPPDFRETMFTREGPDRWRVKPHLRPPITWRVHDLVADPPPQTEFAIIFLRNNLLTYFDEPIRSAAFSRIVGQLAPGGVLAIGAHERLPQGDFGLTPHPTCPLLHVRP